ncbi:GntR family transcriptional regulator [Alicyclobacillus fodiniaquatilis]|uniref:GntR family transcriptional regulator n=1 Tax=Alicyclobacillus fodiniaquatilis TaxID=1661150 RepID=A0ABW4JEA3_9BACL
MKESGFTPPSYNTKQEFIYQALRDAIMRCEIQPEQRLIIQNIADQFGVSSIPVREALRMLHSEDLIEYKPHIGAIASPISKASIVETFTIKEALEAVATRTAVERMTPENLQLLKQHVADMDDALQNGDYEAWGALNTEFHDAITNMTGMPMLKEITKKILNKWNRIRHYFFSEVLVHRLIRSQEEHHAIMRAIAEGNAEEAEQLAKAHNQNALKDYMAHLE